MRINGIELTQGEYGVYCKAASAARLRYLKAHGSPATVNVDGKHAPASKIRANAAAWRLEHQSSYDAAADRAGVSAVKKLHNGRVKLGDTAAAERLEVLGLTGRRKRAAVAPVPAAAVSVAEIAAVSDGRVILATVTAAPVPVHAGYTLTRGGAEESGPVCSRPDDVTCDDVDAADGVTCGACLEVLERLEREPVAVPAPMPEQTRAARKESNRELAAAMRAVGLEPRGEAWRMARDGIELGEIRRQLEARAVLA